MKQKQYAESIEAELDSKKEKLETLQKDMKVYSVYCYCTGCTFSKMKMSFRRNVFFMKINLKN